MAHYKNGNFQGRIGNRVYYRLNGKTVVRSVGRTEKAPSLKQLTCRQRLKVLNTFFKPIKAFLNVGFALQQKGTSKSAYSEAMGHNLERATTGEYPDVVLNYANVRVSRGKLLPPLDSSVAQEAAGLRFSWSQLEVDYQNRYDAAMVLIYFPENGAALCLLNAAQRQTGEVFVPLDAAQLLMEKQIYLAFAAEGRNGLSDSVYLGKL
ncbi:DUF6266 family protein [Pedobacter sp. GR22-6]|uniref:DUF6266 family protein n=1 Tax=Pedobacter sp. GR22-6 TaxID=3127957 RepID=UPI00307F6323